MNPEIIIDLTLQNGHPSRPLVDVHVPCGSAAAFRLRGLKADPSAVVGVTAFNADGVPLAIEAVRDGDGWKAVFPETHFAAYGFTENGFRVTLTADGATYTAAYGNLVIDKVDAGSTPGDPTAHFLTKEELAALFDAISVADTATQKEVRIALQAVLEKLKGVAQ